MLAFLFYRQKMGCSFSAFRFWRTCVEATAVNGARGMLILSGHPTYDLSLFEPFVLDLVRDLFLTSVVPLVQMLCHNFRQPPAGLGGRGN